MTSIQRLQKEIYRDYASQIGLDPNATYLHGTHLRPVVPLDANPGGLFVLGAYPSARFAQIGRIADVPVADNLGPFEHERWFDGSRVREQPSARELRDLFLEPLGLYRNKDCWITDLVKVFLFKPGHVAKYKKLNAEAPCDYTRNRFFELGEKSLPWLERELVLAKPKLVITLGAEVAGVLRGVKTASAQVKLLKAEVASLQVGRVTVSVMHCAHPGILMRRQKNNPWPAKHKRYFIPALRSALGK